MHCENEQKNSVEIKNRIVQRAAELFIKYGIRSVTLDEIARDLGISKKTIYQHFTDKDEIVYEAIRTEMERDKCEFEELNKSSANVIEKMMKTSEMMRVQFASFNPALIQDIKKYYPRAWQIVEQHNQQFILESILQDLRWGIEEGLFRADTSVEILARMRMEQVLMGFDFGLFPADKFSILEVQLVFLDHFIRGILTPAGLGLYNQYTHDLQGTVKAAVPFQS